MESSFGVRKGAWTVEEDNLLRRCIESYGEGRWHQVPLRAGLNRCRKSCRLRWLNYLKPNIKRGEFSVDEIDLILRLHKLLGNRWSIIAGRIPGRTANDIKNYWNTKLHKKVCEEQTKATVRQHGNIIDQSKTKVIRPRPRTFSKNYSSSSLVITIPTTTDNNLKAPKSMEHNDICGTDSTRAAVAEASVEVHEPNNLLNSTEYDHFTNLWDEKKVMELGDNFMSDLSFDVDFWDFFATDQAAPEAIIREASPLISFCPINCPTSDNEI